MEQHPVVISVCGKPGTDATYVEFVEKQKDTHFVVVLPASVQPLTPISFQ